MRRGTRAIGPLRPPHVPQGSNGQPAQNPVPNCHPRRFASAHNRRVLKSVALALLLSLAGGVLILTAFVWIGTHQPHAWLLLFLGVLVVLPGAYHLHVAYQAYRGRRGYDFSDIPEV